MLKNFRDIPAFCINLDRRTDRWNKFATQPVIQTMIESGQLKKWSAVDGKTLDLKMDPRISLLCKKNIQDDLRRAHEELNSIGGVGCALSHIGIWKWLVESEHDAVLIFEDDCKLPIDFIQKMQFTIDNSRILQNGAYDLVVPGNTAIPAARPERFLVEVDIFYGLYCYIITKECAKKILPRVFPIMEHIDLWLCLYKFLYGLRIYNVHTGWIGIRHFSSISDITPEDKCPLCNMRPDFYKTGRIIRLPDFYFMRAAQIGLAGFTGWWLWKRYAKT